MKRKMKKLWQKMMYRLWQKKSWNKLTLGLTRRNQGPSRLSELILLLKEYKDVFAWGYSEMSRLDPGLVVQTLRMDPEAKPIA